MKQACNEDVSQKKGCFLCPVSECSQSYFHAMQLMKHLKVYNVGDGKKSFTFNVLLHEEITDDLVLPDWSAFLQWKERGYSHATKSQMNLNLKLNILFITVSLMINGENVVINQL